MVRRSRVDSPPSAGIHDGHRFSRRDMEVDSLHPPHRFILGAVGPADRNHFDHLGDFQIHGFELLPKGPVFQSAGEAAQLGDEIGVQRHIGVHQLRQELESFISREKICPLGFPFASRSPGWTC